MGNGTSTLARDTCSPAEEARKEIEEKWYEYGRSRTKDIACIRFPAVAHSLLAKEHLLSPASRNVLESLTITALLHENKETSIYRYWQQMRSRVEYYCDALHMSDEEKEKFLPCFEHEMYAVIGKYIVVRSSKDHFAGHQAFVSVHADEPLEKLYHTIGRGALEN